MRRRLISFNKILLMMELIKRRLEMKLRFLAVFIVIAFGVLVFGASTGVFAGWQNKGNEENVSTITTDKPLPDAKTGTPLPAGGGEPGKVYMIYLKAVQTKDLKTLKKVSSLEEDDVSGDAVGYTLELLAEMAPKNVKIIRGYVSGNRAALYAEGIYDNEKQYGTIEMLKEKNGPWRLAKENWSNVRPKKW